MNDLPRASSWYKDQNCAGNRAMTAKAEQAGMLPPADTPDTLRGTRVHEGKPATRDELDAMQFTETALLKAFRDELPDLREEEIVRENRLYLRDGLLPYFTGQPDRYIVRPAGRIVVGDLKPGFEADWEAWEYQLTAYAALLADNFPAALVTGFIATRFFGVRRWDWDAHELESERDLIRKLVAKDGEVTPGPWCRYCQARLICDAAISYGGLMEEGQPPLEQSPGGLLGSEVIDKLKLFIKLATDRLAWYTEQIKANPDFAPGWKLATKKRAHITDVKAACAQLLESNTISSVDLWKAVSISLPKVREAIAASNNQSLVKAKQVIEGVLGSLLEYKESEPFLVKASEVKELTK